jgi:hypothetical protein
MKLILEKTLPVRWYMPNGYYVRRQSRTGYVTGHLTSSNGWSKPERAEVFATRELAEAAVDKNNRWSCVQILHNTNPQTLTPLPFYGTLPDGEGLLPKLGY